MIQQKIESAKEYLVNYGDNSICQRAKIPTHTYLYKENMLSEFNSESEKEQARYNLGIDLNQYLKNEDLDNLPAITYLQIENLINGIS